MLPITDITGDTQLLTNVKQIVRSRKVNGEKTIQFITIPDESNDHSFAHADNESTTIFKNEPYIIKQVNEKSVGATSIKQIGAVHTFFNTMINCYQYDLFSGSQTFFAALTRVFDNTPYTFVIVDSFTSKEFENFGRDNCLSLFKNVLERYSAEFKVVGTVVYLETEIGVKTDFQLRWKSNIKALDKQVDTDSLATVIKGFGGKPNEQTGVYPIQVEYRSPNEALFGELHADAVYDERLSTIAGMTAHLEKTITDEPQLSITVDIAELGGDVKNEGDRGFIIYEPMNLTLEARIVEITETFEYVNGQWVVMKTDVTLSNLRNKLTDITTRFAQTSKRVDRLFEGQERLPYNVLPEAIRIAAEAINNSLTEIQYPVGQGIILQDPINPLIMVRLTSAGIGLSDDGGTTYRTAMTGAGIVTNELVAGVIRTNNIQIVGEDDLFYWNGEALWAHNATDLTKYVKLNSDGMYIAKGALTLERPDGFKLITDGQANFDLNIQSGTPQYISDATYGDGVYVVTTDGPYTRTASTSFQRFDYYRFRQTSRYVNFAFYARGGGDGAYAYVRIVKADGTTLQTQMTNSTADTIVGITVDLGVPDGSTQLWYAEIKTTSAANPARVRLATKYMTG